MKKIAILQSNYLPWKGVFDIINQVDIFVFLEDVQFTTRDWRNRNKVYTKDGLKWITIPVIKGPRSQLIYEVKIDQGKDWQRKHFNTFQINYGRALYFKKYKWIIEDIYCKHTWESLSKLNIYTIELIARTLGIKTKFMNSAGLNTKGSKDDKLIEICKKLGADYYLSGPAAKDYINPKKFKDENIILDYIEYKYPEYNQLYKTFNHFVTILDLIFNCGDNSAYYIWGWREDL